MIPPKSFLIVRLASVGLTQVTAHVWSDIPEPIRQIVRRE